MLASDSEVFAGIAKTGALLGSGKGMRPASFHRGGGSRCSIRTNPKSCQMKTIVAVTMIVAMAG